MREVHLVSTIIGLASKIKFKKNQFLVPTFLLEEKPNPTVKWLRRIRKDHPEKKLSLLLGFDSLRTIDQWIDYKDILGTLDCIYLVSRMENDEERSTVMEVLVKQAPNLMIQHLGHHDFEGLSSTEIRKRR
jgi:nicotinic acid mononucleotide adenylyltransferase